jgi:hypothetical protein
LNLRSGCLSIFWASGVAVRERASRASSILEALRAGAPFEVEGVSSSWERSRPRVFLTAVLAFAPLGVARAFFSSSARRASFSAFLRAASSFFAASASLFGGASQTR